MPQVMRPALWRYGVAVLSVGLAVPLMMSLGGLAPRMPFAFFFAAVMLSAWYGGYGPGLVATVLGGILSAYLFVPPQYSFNIGLDGNIQLGVFLMVALFINLLAASRMRAQEAVRENERWLSTTLGSIGDAVIATDAHGRVIFVNAVAQSLTGWKQKEASGKELAEVFRIINEDTRQEVESPVVKVIREGSIVGLANHTLLIAKDGREVPIDDSGAPIRDETGEIAGVVLVFRDIAERKQAEHSRGRLAAIVESSDDVIIGKTLDGIITSWNAGAERVYGYSAEEAVGSPVSILVPSDLTDEVPHILEIIRSGGDFKNYETMRRKKDGTQINVSLTISPIKDRKGNIVGASTIARDITEQKRSERALRDSEMRLTLALEAARMGTWQWDVKSGDISWSESVEPLHGIAPGTFGGTFEAFTELVHPEDREMVSGAIARSLEEKTDYQIEFRVVWPDGSVHWIEGKGRAFYDDAGQPVRMIGLAIDITERKQAEEALRASEERYRAFVAQSAEAIWRYEFERPVRIDLSEDEQIEEFYRNGKLAECNDVMAQMYGFREASEITGARLGDLLVRSDPENENFLRACIRAGYRLDDAESSELDREGKQKYFLNNLVGIVEDGALRRVWGTQRDITVRKLAEEERDRLLASEREARARSEEANRAKDEFLATLSHELRTPLTAMLGWTRMMRTRDLDKTTTAHALETIERNVRAQAQLIEDLLDVSRIITGNLRLDVRPVELLPIIEAALDSVRPAADAKSIQLQTALNPLTGPVSGDPARLQQVVWNLVSNAVKFTQKGGRVDVRLGRVDSHIEINVSDTGQGVSPEFLPHVFDRFRQADSSTTRAHGGLGLGLAIVRHLVELHGGTVEVESDGEGRGSTFRVKFPLMAASAKNFDAETRERETTTAHGAPDGQAMLEDLSVLVVDDEQDARDLIATVLERCGASVLAVGTVAEALLALRESRPDILVSDIGMPGEDGYDLIRRVRELPESQGGSLPAVALTAYAGKENRRQALEAGFQIHLSKPVDPGELASAIASLVRPADKI
ncbi:MAG: PAS domain S-box protein [Pyrinomonadaceae bacterium]